MLTTAKASQVLASHTVALRRTLHHIPELSFKEEKTAQLVIKELKDIGLPYSYEGVGHGVVASLEVDPTAPWIALRADMDALPGAETTGLPFASSIEGNMHACGHDAHMAMVLGAARILEAQHPKVNVKFVFQPAEENGGGARTIINSGILKDVQAIFGGHVTHHYKVGELMIAEGTITAQSDRFRIQVHGRSGHGARPHEGIDAIVIAGLLITSLQTLISRETNPLHPSVITVGTIHAGTAPNVIADSAVLEGTIRTTDPDIRKHIHSGIKRMAQAYGELHMAELDLSITSGYPPVVNTSQETRIARQAAQEVVGNEGLMQMDHPSMGSEDFAYYLENIPGCYVRFGARPKDIDYIPLHSPSFDIDEDVLPIGAAYFAELAYQATRFLPMLGAV